MNTDFKETCWVTLTALDIEECRDGVASVSRRLHVWGNGHDLTNGHPDATAVMVWPVEPTEREDDGSIYQGKVIAGSRPSTPTVLMWAHVVCIEPGEAIREALF